MSRKPGKPAGSDWVYGLHSAESRLARDPGSIIEAFLDGGRKDARMQKMRQLLEAHGIPCQQLSRRELSQRVDANHQGILLRTRVARQKPEQALYSLLEKIGHPPLLLVLDQVTDPHNLGACLRTADGAGVDAVVLPRDGACPINETVRRVASGAVDTIEVFYVTNLARTLRELQSRGLWVAGLADTAAESINEVVLKPPLVVVMGAEGRGMRRLTQAQCDQLVSIPMRGKVSSLNVSVATGVVLYAVDRSGMTP